MATTGAALHQDIAAQLRALLQHLLCIGLNPRGVIVAVRCHIDNAHGMLAGYTTPDLQAVWAFKPWRITAKLLNALDRKYSPLAGYSAFFNDTYFYPADRRSAFVSGRFDF